MDLTQHLQSADPAVATIILTIAKESKRIRSLFFTSVTDANTKNVYGEAQIELEKQADLMLIDALKKLSTVQSIATEEQDAIIETGRGAYSVALDPLDGSSCIKTNISVGTIAGIFSGSLLGDVRMVAGMYVLYGPLTTLVYTTGKGVHEFVLSEHGYVLRRENIRIPEGKIVSPGGLRKDFTLEHRALLERVEERGFKLRYTGSFVADMNQILEYGGFYCYPKLKTEPNGKLRVLFEALPLAFIIQNAGGYATDGRLSILSVKPQKVDQRTPLYIGSSAIVKEIAI